MIRFNCVIAILWFVVQTLFSNILFMLDSIVLWTLNIFDFYVLFNVSPCDIDFILIRVFLLSAMGGLNTILRYIRLNLYCIVLFGGHHQSSHKSPSPSVLQSPVITGDHKHARQPRTCLAYTYFIILCQEKEIWRWYLAGGGKALLGSSWLVEVSYTDMLCGVVYWKVDFPSRQLLCK